MPEVVRLRMASLGADADAEQHPATSLGGV